MDSRHQLKQLGNLIDKNYGRTRSENKKEIACDADNNNYSASSRRIIKESSDQPNGKILPGMKFMSLQESLCVVTRNVSTTCPLMAFGRVPPRWRVVAAQYNMTAHLVLLALTCFFVSANRAENVFPDNGWRPMSIEKILELQRGFIKTPDVYSKISAERPTVMDDLENKHFVKIIQVNEISKKPIEDHKVVPVTESYEEDTNDYQELIKLIQPPHKEMIKYDDINASFNHGKQSHQLRKSKKIENSIIAVQNNAATDQKNSNGQKEKTENKNYETVQSKSYKVKENIEGEHQSASDQKVLFTKELKHRTLKSADVNKKTNLTANLLDILANYNIRTSDNLRNYDISLRPNSRNSHNHDFVYVPIKLPMRYNNANHLLVDPLLAVFLSNYGHYLPSFYGFHGGYNNLYGYLASNNIHNNKPFGSYKIFSDTDSIN